MHYILKMLQYFKHIEIDRSDWAALEDATVNYESHST